MRKSSEETTSDSPRSTGAESAVGSAAGSTAESETGSADSVAATAVAEPSAQHRRRLSRRGWTLTVSAVLVLAFVLTGFFVRVPYVAIGPGPTYDTLGAVGNTAVVRIDGRDTFPTTGQLRMTTVSLTDDVTMFGAFGLWVSGRYALAPREEYYAPGETDEQVKQENVKQFQDSQSNAEVAALRLAGYPVQVLADNVVPRSAADSVLAPGDRLISVNGRNIAEAVDVRAALAGTKPGQRIDLVVQPRGQQPRTVALTLGGNPDRAEGFIGLTPVDRADVNFTISISLQDVGGPSAGMMFALAILDRISPDDLAGGRTIAGTGEIDSQGQVGAIGGISFKVVAAREAGVTDFLTPAANCAEAKAAAPDGLHLIKVGTLQDARSALLALKANQPTPEC